MKAVAPSIYAAEKWHERSDRYRFVPTVEVLDALRDSGFYPVRAGQSNSRIPGKRNYTRHMIRLRHEDMTAQDAQVNDLIPEIVLVNSHDGTSCYHLTFGIYRLVCRNGLVVGQNTLEAIKVRHTGGRGLCTEVIRASRKLVKNTRLVLAEVDRLNAVRLGKEGQLDFARRALGVYESSIEVEPERVLWARRNADLGLEDGSRSLWETFNVVQENLIRGGIYGRNQEGRTRRLRAVRSIDRDIDLNRSLWGIASEMAELRGEVPARSTAAVGQKPAVVLNVPDRVVVIRSREDVPEKGSYESAKRLISKYGAQYVNHLNEL